MTLLKKGLAALSIISFIFLLAIIGYFYLSPFAFSFEKERKPINSITFSHQAGFYHEDISLTLQTSVRDGEIRYTTDGVPPHANTKKYEGPISLPLSDKKEDLEVYPVTASVFVNGKCVDTAKSTYFVGRGVESRFSNKVISIVTDPANLYDPQTGIAMPGDMMYEWVANNPNGNINGAVPANYNQRGKAWERPVSIEFFDSRGNLEYKTDCGIRIFGNWSRAHLEKPFRIIARKEYDFNTGRFEYDPFSDLDRSYDQKPLTSFKRLVLRLPSDFCYGMIRDEVLQEVSKPSGLDMQNARLATLYINGKYHGIRSIRDPIDEDYFEERYDINKNDCVILTYSNLRRVVDSGNENDMEFLSWMMDHYTKADLGDSKKYEELCSYLDMENYIKFLVIQSFVHNEDVDSFNVRYWRERLAENDPGAEYGRDGKWRMILFDLDGGMNAYVSNNKQYEDYFAMIFKQEKSFFPLAENLYRTSAEFRKQFVNIYMDYLNTIFKPENVISIINKTQMEYAGEMRYQVPLVQSFKYDQLGYGEVSYENYNIEVNQMRRFARERPQYMKGLLKTYFNLEGTCEISGSIEGGGTMKVNSLTVNAENGYQGEYFVGNPIQVEAAADPGWVFSHWIVNGEKKQELSSLTPQEDTQITAVFVKEQSKDTLVLNEIGCLSGFAEDWLEVYNYGSEAVFLSEYALSDDKDKTDKWTFPNITLQPGEGLRVYCTGQNLNSADKIHTNFRISNGEKLFLIKKQGKKILDTQYAHKTDLSMSYGRYPDASSNWVYMKETPGAKNRYEARPPRESEAVLKNRICFNGLLLDNDAKVRVRDGTPYVSSLFVRYAFSFRYLNETDRALLEKSPLHPYVWNPGGAPLVWKEQELERSDGEIMIPVSLLAKELNLEYAYLEKTESVLLAHKDWKNRF